MSVAEIKREMEVLPDQDRRDLIAYLVHLEQIKDDTYLREMTQRLDEKEKFVKWDEIKDDFIDE